MWRSNSGVNKRNRLSMAYYRPPCQVKTGDSSWACHWSHDSLRSSGYWSVCQVRTRLLAAVPPATTVHVLHSLGGRDRWGRRRDSKREDGLRVVWPTADLIRASTNLSSTSATTTDWIYQTVQLTILYSRVRVYTNVRNCVISSVTNCSRFLLNNLNYVQQQ